MNIVSLIMVVFLVVLLGISFYASKKIKGLTDFYVAGRNMPWWVVWFSLQASAISAATFLGVVGELYDLGWNTYHLFIGIGLGHLTAITIIGPRIRKSGALTWAEFLDIRYDSKIVRGASATMLFVTHVALLVTEIIAVALVFTHVFGMSYGISVVVVALFVGLYVLVGGALSVAWTDVLQFIMFMFTFIVAVPMLISFLGDGSIFDGFYRMAIELPPEWWSTGFAAFFLLPSWLLALSVYPLDITRVLMARSTRDVWKAAAGVGIGFFIMYAFFPIMPGALRLILPNIDDKETVFIVAALDPNLFPVWLGAIFIAGIVAQSLSSQNAIFLVVGQSFARDIYQKV